MKTERVQFQAASGHTLAGRLDVPATPPRAYALFAHCFTCGKDIAAASRISRALTDHGIAVLRFDFTGLGQSEGAFGDTDFLGNVDDLVSAADFLRTNHRAPSILIGHSLGGAAVIAAAGRVPEAKAVATIAAPADPEHVTHLFGESLETIECAGSATVSLAGRPFVIGKAFVDSVRETQLESALAKLGKALLIFHSPIDQLVGIENAGRLFGAAKHPKSFVSLDTADHLLSKAADSAYVATVLAAWAGRYVPDEAPASRPVSDPGKVVVHETGAGKFQQAIAMGPHHILADEPASVGGDETGPTPYDLLLAGLGACTSMTMRMYAERKGWPLERAVVTLAHDKIHATDCASCETSTGRVDRIRRKIRLDGPLSDAQRERILGIADRCPVHRTLHSEVLIETESE